MSRPTDVTIRSTALYFMPVTMRVPLKFGASVMTSITCARVRLEVEDAQGHRAVGWGETPLSVAWVWPSHADYDARHDAIKAFCQVLVAQLPQCKLSGHPIELGYRFQQQFLPGLTDTFNADRDEPMPYLAALVCLSAFDIALHDAFGVLHEIDIYKTYNADFMSSDLAAFMSPAQGSQVTFQNQYPQDYLISQPASTLPAWHLVGGLDPIDAAQLTGDEPDDGHPVLLEDWIKRDDLNCLKIKLRGNDADWDDQRLIAIGQIAEQHDVDWLTTDFNCTVTEPGYVNRILDKLRDQHPRIYGKILYVEQPFPHDLQTHQIDVSSVSARKPLYMDESAHDWHLVKLGKTLGWTGVALKTCKTQTGALLSLCWAKAHGMGLMVQDLTNPMLAQIPHVRLAAHAGTIMGVETNAMQFYPDASSIEQKIHPGLYQRRHGTLDLSTLDGPGFGYRLQEMARDLPEPIATANCNV